MTWPDGQQPKGEIMLVETATIHRYQGHDEDHVGIADGTLIAVTEADYDDDKVSVWFTLPDLRNPECAAYLSEIGPELATIEIVERGEAPWGMGPADPADVPVAVAAAEEKERADAALMADPRIVEAIQTLRSAGVTVPMIDRALAELAMAAE